MLRAVHVVSMVDGGKLDVVLRGVLLLSVSEWVSLAWCRAFPDSPPSKQLKSGNCRAGSTTGVARWSPTMQEQVHPMVSLQLCS